MTRIDSELVRKRARKGGVYYRVAIAKPVDADLDAIIEWTETHGSGAYAMMRHDYHAGVWGYLFAFSREEDAFEFKVRWK